jgi:hypothetical protein
MRLLTIALASALLSASAGAQETASVAQMSAAAETFLATLTDEQRALASTPSLDDDETRAQ